MRKGEADSSSIEGGRKTTVEDGVLDTGQIFEERRPGREICEKGARPTSVAEKVHSGTFTYEA